MTSRTTLAAVSWLVLAGMIGISTWASLQIGIGDSIADLVANPADGNNPWLYATLFDAYFGFLWFWLFIAWREESTAVIATWAVLLVFLGNIAMAVYMLLALRKLPKGAPMSALVNPRSAG